MTRTLLLIRHGKSDWKAGYDDDHERPLKQRGVKAVKRMGRWLAMAKLQPDVVLTSTAKRARGTAALIGVELGGPSRTVEDARLYDTDVATLLRVIGSHAGEARCVMVVGHNPELETLLLYLAQETPAAAANGKLLPTGAIAVLEHEHQWAALREGTVTVRQIVRPREIAEPQFDRAIASGHGRAVR